MKDNVKKVCIIQILSYLCNSNIKLFIMKLTQKIKNLLGNTITTKINLTKREMALIQYSIELSIDGRKEKVADEMYKLLDKLGILEINEESRKNID